MCQSKKEMLKKINYHTWIETSEKLSLIRKCHIINILKNQNSRTWEKYRQSMNLVNIIKKKNNPLKSAFKIGVLVAVNLQIFGAQLNKIILFENDRIISYNEEVAEFFNNYLVNVVDGIRKDYVFDP